MKNFLTIVILLLLCHGGRAQTFFDSTFHAGMPLDELIARFDGDSERTLDCYRAKQLFRLKFDQHPKDASAVLYLARSYDRIASVGNWKCVVPDSLFMNYADTAIYYFHLADKLEPGITDRKFHFTVPVMIGHVFGSRALWQMQRHEYVKAKEELAHGMKEGGYTPAQLEYCRLLLDYCDTNSIFFTMGDDDTFPTMYLQMVKGYRPDVSVLNTSLMNMSWYLKLFLGSAHPGITPVPIEMTGAQVDSVDEAVTSPSIPDRIYADVDPSARERIHRELGVDVADKAELCFPVFQQSSETYYTLGASRAIASILQANKWKRKVYFGNGLQSILGCQKVAARGIFVTELYPLNSGQIQNFKKRDVWYDNDKTKRIFLEDLNAKKIFQDQSPSFATTIIYISLCEYLSSLDVHSDSVKQLISLIASFPLRLLSGYEKDILYAADYMYRAGYYSEAKKVCAELLPSLRRNANGSSDDKADYLRALILGGDCAAAKDFLRSLDMTTENKEATLKQMREMYRCQ